jgi:AraC-like DNA-binding protein
MTAADSARDWARYWRSDGVPVEAMHAHFTSHVYHRHSHESYSFGVTETGAQAFTCRNGRHVSGTGMVMAFNPDDPHDGHAAGDSGFTYRMVHIWPEFFASLIGAARPLPLFLSPVLDDPVTARSLRRLHLALTGPEAGATELERYERLADTARLLVRHSSARDQAAEPAGTAGSDARVAARIRELLHDRYAAADLTAPDPTSADPTSADPTSADPTSADPTSADPTSADLTSPDLTSTDLAAAAGCSRFAAYRAFHQVYGLAPSDYQRQLRVRAARRLLARDIAPAVAAAEAGFADQAHLTRWFRRYYGVTPGAYRAAMHPRAGTSR